MHVLIETANSLRVMLKLIYTTGRGPGYAAANNYSLVLNNALLITIPVANSMNF